jgi:hypothetical protein
MAELGRAGAGLPDDLLKFPYDPVACAVTGGWNGAVVEAQRLRPWRRASNGSGGARSGCVRRVTRSAAD